ncbi:GNAT family N-acetyltransferase [Micromonospora inositola]|uniref:Acetyltransferase (GNAT) domain-containing protein n=1 Tax=Micromonospora inositola TaxID=47865 RepID=A0A1C5K3U9_9ACTN|nr:GNAT family N-acetyltransferase [Micromonospora inositola]SCG77261.1 Acetyltransferase (GNAT) domain-containing protein [Micromonospora inositola]
MGDAAVRISAAHADTADLTPAGDDWAVVSGVPCQHIALPYPWATIGRVLALPGPPTADQVIQVADWLRARSRQWTLMVRAEDEHQVAGFQRWDLMPVLALQGQPPSRPRSVADIGPAGDRDEFLVPYGGELAPLVTDAHLASGRMHHLVARVGGEPVGCARVRLMADTAYLGAITVLPTWQGKGIGTALSIAAGELAGRYSDLVWLHCTPGSRALYERLGYRQVDDHALLVPVQGPS